MRRELWSYRCGRFHARLVYSRPIRGPIRSEAWAPHYYWFMGVDGLPYGASYGLGRRGAARLLHALRDASDEPLTSACRIFNEEGF